MLFLPWFLVNFSGGNALTFIVDCIRSLVWCCCLQTGETVPWVSTKTLQGPQGMDSFEGISFLVLSFYMYASLTLMCLRVCGRSPLSSYLYHYPVYRRCHTFSLIPNLTVIYCPGIKSLRHQAKWQFKNALLLKGKPRKARPKKILKNIEPVKKYWNSILSW